MPGLLFMMLECLGHGQWLPSGQCSIYGNTVGLCDRSGINISVEAGNAIKRVGG